MGPLIGVLGGTLYASLVHPQGGQAATDAVLLGLAGGAFLGLSFAFSM